MFQQNQIPKYCEYHFSISSVAAYLRKSPSIASEARLLLDHAQIGAHRERIVVTELEVWHVRMARCDAALKRAGIHQDRYCGRACETAARPHVDSCPSVQLHGRSHKIPRPVSARG